jgi:hypothetical protein
MRVRIDAINDLSGFSGSVSKILLQSTMSTLAATTTWCRMLALLLSLFASHPGLIRINAQPINDLCPNSTNVASFPFTEYGTNLLNATNDVILSNNCGGGNEGIGWVGNDVWYKIHNVPEDAEINVTISGTGRVLVSGWVIMSNETGTSNNTSTTIITCPDMSNCVQPVDMIRMNWLRFPTDTSLNETAYSYSWRKALVWPATKDSIYYLAVFTPQTTFNNTIDDDGAVIVVPPVFDLSINYTLPRTPDNVDKNASTSHKPINDLCTSATEVTTFPYFEYGTLGNATKENLLSNCPGSAWNGTDVWYKISNVPEGARIDVGTSGFGSAFVSVRPFASSNSSCPGATSDDDEEEEEDESEIPSYCTLPEGMLSMSSVEASIDGSRSWAYTVYWNATKDAAYYVALHTQTEEVVVPKFDLFIGITHPRIFDESDVVSTDPQINDLCASATEVSTFPFNASGTLVNTTKDELSTCHDGTMWEGNDVWYKIHEVPEGAEIRVDIFGFGREVLEAYVTKSGEDGNCPDESKCVEPERVYAISSIGVYFDWEFSIYWPAAAGTIYYLAVFANDSSESSTAFDIYINYTFPAPFNDYCESISAISAFPYTDSTSLENATQDSYSSCAGGAAGWKGNDVWYKIGNVPDGKVVQVHMSGNGTSMVQVKPLLSNDLGDYCPERSQCVEPLASVSTPIIDDETGYWEYSVVWSTSESLIYYLVVYTEEENVGPAFDLSVKLSDPYNPTTNLSSHESTATTTNSSSTTNNASSGMIIGTILVPLVFVVLLAVVSVVL